MQCTADFHDPVADARLSEAAGVVDNTAAFDAAVDMFDAHPSPSDLPIPCFLRSRQLLSAGLLRQLDDVHAVQREGLKAQVLQQLAPCRQWIRRGVGEPLVMDTPWMRLTEEQNAQGPIDQEEVFQHVPLFLAAIASFLFSRVLGARDGSLGTVMTKRGAAEGGAACTSAAGEASAGKGGSANPNGSRRASTWRQGASPKVRSVWRNTGSKT